MLSPERLTARVWDLDGNEINVLKGHNGQVQEAHFFPDGKSVITCSKDGTARIWPVFIEDVFRKINDEKFRGDVWSPNRAERKIFGMGVN